LARPGGRVVVLDYLPHDDEALRDEQADVWLGFEPEDLAQQARDAGLSPVTALPLPAGFAKNAIDGHLGWLLFVASRPRAAAVRGAPAGKRSRASKSSPQQKEQR
jgi:hypothetical protein